MRPLALIPMLALCAACNFSTASAGTLPPTTLPASVTVDDQIGISVELAYQAAALAERTAVKAGMVDPVLAAKLQNADNEAYAAVCYTRSAYNLANGENPVNRKDQCPSYTKRGKLVGYAQAGQRAIETILVLVSLTQQASAQ